MDLTFDFKANFTFSEDEKVQTEKVRDLKIPPLVLKVSCASAGGCILIFASIKGRSTFENNILPKNTKIQTPILFFGSLFSVLQIIAKNAMGKMPR